MSNKDDLLKNYIESQKRQREIIEESKKRRAENNNQKEKIDDHNKTLSFKTDHENKDYLMKEELQSDYDKKLIHEIKLRENCLELALKCENEVDKINFIDNEFFRGMGDGDDDNWYAMMYSFLDQFDLDDESFEFVMEEIESICFDENRLWKNDKVITKFKKIFPEFEKFKKDFKLFIFSFYFDEDPHSVYRGEIEFYKRHFA